MKLILSLSTVVLLTINIAKAQFFGSFADLDGAPYSSTTPENFYQSEAHLDSAVLAVYNSLSAASWGEYMILQEIASDAIFVPTRGGDWDDGGTWRALQQHTWTPSHSHVNWAWMEAYTGIARANVTIDSLESSAGDALLIATLIAEVRFLRALYYWWLIDLFGGVPLVIDPVTNQSNSPEQSTRTEVFNFIVAEINLALPDLEDSFTADSYDRATKGAANALLATVYLNAEVYTGTAMWSECVAACDAVINSGLYALMPTFSDVFALANEGTANTENIFVVVHKPESGLGFVRHMATLHFNQLPANPWNGFSVLADYYNRFDTADARIDQLLVGPQKVLGGPNAGDQAYERFGDSLIFTVESPLIDVTESDGVRILKWPIDPNMSGSNAGNDYALFRYSHILLAKAEAQFMLGSTGAALALVNLVRARNFDPDQPLASVTRDDIFNERGYELIWEGFRRQDQIRTGHFLEAWSNKDANTDDVYRTLFPIPQFQLDVNCNLVQNVGYETYDVVCPEPPVIISVSDVTEDQGRWVHVSWINSWAYEVGASITVWELDLEGEWVSVGNVTAMQDSSYIYMAPTYGDSTAAGIQWSKFKVSAHAGGPQVSFFSEVDSGYSVDNLSPAVPSDLLASVIASGSVQLAWSDPVDEDFNYFRIYRSESTGFDPTGAVALAEVVDPVYADAGLEVGLTLYYRVSAVDANGNESGFSEEVSATILAIDAASAIPTDFALRQNYPNPFNPITTIAYQIPKSTYVNLAIYNINGQLVEELVNERKNAGFYSVQWNAANFSSGLYFFLIEAGEYKATKKCLVLK